ncbi:MAG TPA: HAD family hydrolase [Longimicrobiaceae bacterium]
MLSTVILDIDGTLLDSNEAHARAFVDAARELGFPAPPVEEVLRLIGMGGDKLIPRAFGFEQDAKRGEMLEERKGDIFRSRYLPSLAPTPGARALLERLRDDGFTLVVATSANEEDLKGLLDRAGVRDLIEEATSSGDVEESKPDPDIVHAALASAGAEAPEAIMLGDTPYDVEAATRAGVAIIGVRSGGWKTEDLGGAAMVFDHPADLLAHYDATPLGAASRQRMNGDAPRDDG